MAYKNKTLIRRGVCKKRLRNGDVANDKNMYSQDILKGKHLVDDAIPSVAPKSLRHNPVNSKRRKVKNVLQNKSNATKMNEASQSSLTIQNIYTIQMECSMRENAKELFNVIHSGDAYPVLPNKSWAIHCTETPCKSIVISEMMTRRVNNVGLVPLYVKQIVFDDKLNFELYLLNSRTVLRNKPCMLQTMKDFEHIVVYVDSLKLCAGGPEITQYSNINPECAYKDPMDKWRHNLCPLDISDADVCELCLSLDEVLRRQAQRHKLTKRNVGSATKRKK